jgi:hypothetical protein|tara:strand:+ start:332 stop:592 length:261 start_codon:yes stop_codon:yes gene_type:complete
MIKTDSTNDTPALMVISQRDINSLQKTLDQELAHRAEDANKHLDTIIAEQGMYATVVIPMNIFKRKPSPGGTVGTGVDRLMVRRAL